MKKNIALLTLIILPLTLTSCISMPSDEISISPILIDENPTSEINENNSSKAGSGVLIDEMSWAVIPDSADPTLENTPTEPEIVPEKTPIPESTIAPLESSTWATAQ